MKSLLTNCFMFSFLILLPVFTSAEEKPLTLEEIVVTATKIKEPVEETTSDVIVIEEEEIKKMNVQFVTDVFRKIPELNLVQNGGVGQLATVLLRGGDSSHTLVMIDGVRVQDPATGSFNFSTINIDDIDRIEIVKGPQSTFYGSEAMAGVINIIMKKGKGKPKIDLSFESGSYGTYKPSLTISGGEKEFDYRLTTSYFSTDGISAAKEGTERDGYKNAFISGKLGFRPTEKLEVELSGKYYYDRTELDFGSSSPDDTNYIQHGNHHILSGKGKLFLLNMWEQILTVSTVKDSLKTRDPDPDPFLWYNSDVITGMDTIDWQHNFYLSEIYILTTGAEYRKEKAENTGNFDRTMENKALYLSNKLKLFKEDLVFNAGIRYDDYETFGGKTTYRIGATYNIRSAICRIRGSYGTGFRAPTLNELYYPGFGNPDLKPEKTTSWELGLEKDILKDNISVSLIYFEQNYKNLIEYILIDPITWRMIAANIAKAEIKGIEAGATLKLTDHINIRTGYTYLDTEDKTTGQRLTRRPKDKFTLSSEFSTEDISVVADYIFVGKRFDSSVERNLSSYSVINVSSTYKLREGATVFVRIDNLFDKDYEEAGSYGTPGISFFAGVRIAL